MLLSYKKSEFSMHISQLSLSATLHSCYTCCLNVCVLCPTGWCWISSVLCPTAAPTCWLSATLWPGNWPVLRPCSGDRSGDFFVLQADLYTDMLKSFLIQQVWRKLHRSDCYSTARGTCFRVLVQHWSFRLAALCRKKSTMSQKWPWMS